MTEAIGPLAIVGGAVAIGAGLYLVSPVLGLIVGGLLLFLVGAVVYTD